MIMEYYAMHSSLNSNIRRIIMFNLNTGLYSYLQELGIFSSQWQETLVLIGLVLVSIVASYFLGSINSAVLISTVFYKDDIRNHGSGNGGLTNMHRTFGMKAAGLTLLGDMLKTALAIFITGTLLGFFYTHGISAYVGFCYMSALFVVLGHIFPIYYRFKGGKGVLVTAVAALILTPIPFLILLAIFIGVVCLSKYISLGSVSVAVLYPVVVKAYLNVLTFPMDGITALSTILIAILIVWRHWPNLQRISDRTERKFSFKKKPEVDLVKKDDGGDEN